MSDVHDVHDLASARPPATTSDQAELLVSFVAEDRDWADWVADQLGEFGRRYCILAPPVEPGPAALEAVARLRRAGTAQLVIASDGLLQHSGDVLDLDQVDPDAAPLVVVLIEDLTLPAEWGDASCAPMFEARDDHTASRQMLLQAVATALPGWPAPNRDDSEPFPPPWPGLAVLSPHAAIDLPPPSTHPRAGLLGPGAPTSPQNGESGRSAHPEDTNERAGPTIPPALEWSESASVAVTRLEELVRGASLAYGTDDLRTLAARTELAALMRATGSLLRANQMLADVLEDSARRYGEADPATISAKHHLANSHVDLGRHDAAFDLRRQVVASREAVLGADHPRTLSAQGNLANSLAALGQSRQALELREAAAQTRLRTLGPDDAATLSALNNLANSYADFERHEEALSLRQEVLRGRERLFGPDNPHTIAARNNLANSLAALGRHDEADEARAMTVADCERALGPEHPYTSTTRANLAFGGTSAARRSPEGRWTATAVTDVEATLAELNAQRHTDGHLALPSTEATASSPPPSTDVVDTEVEGGVPLTTGVERRDTVHRRAQRRFRFLPWPR